MDFLEELRRDPEHALLHVKNTNTDLLTSIFLAIPELERSGVDLPRRGYKMKAWLLEYGNMFFFTPQN
jgi:hypothetical protein